MLGAFVLALGLAMDAAAVSVARGAVDRRARIGIALAVLFGVAQAGMAALGWGAGAAVGQVIARWDHWVAFGLLAVIGGKMIVTGARHDDAEEVAPVAGVLTYVGLAVATSIDAAAAGLALPLVGPPVPALVVIGVVTALLSGAGFALGGRVGVKFGPRVEIAGGAVLIAIGAKILVEHLTA